MADGKILKPPSRPPKGQRKPKADETGSPAASASPTTVPVVVPQAIAAPRLAGPSPGRKPTGEVEDNRILAWPDLVYTELLCMAVLTAVMLVTSWFARAPLEEIANPAHTPNPSKAPWYFLGLQEALVYFDPWIAGVMLPGLIIVGLMVIPYVDRNPTRGCGYYNWSGRKFAWVFFVSGFAVWWILIVIGSGMRGPGWAWYWPGVEDQHHVKVVVEGQRHHLHFDGPGDFWDKLHLDTLPLLGKIGQKREKDGNVGRIGLCLPGIFLVLIAGVILMALPAKFSPKYFPEMWRRRGTMLPMASLGVLLALLPKLCETCDVPQGGLKSPVPLLLVAIGAVLLVAFPLKLAASKDFFPLLPRGELSPFFIELGFWRYLIVMALVLSAAGLPAKMFCRLVLPWHLKYIVVTPWFYI